MIVSENIDYKMLSYNCEYIKIGHACCRQEQEIGTNENIDVVM